jgi:hypothetical protein
VAGGLRRLHNEELHNFYALPYIIRVVISRRMRWTERVERMGEVRNAYKILIGRFGGKRQLVRPRRRWECNIIMDFREIGLEAVGWVHLAQDTDFWWDLVNTVMKIRVLWRGWNF